MPTYQYVDPKTGQLTTKEAPDETTALQGTGQSGVRLVNEPTMTTQQPTVTQPPQPPTLTPDWVKTMSSNQAENESRMIDMRTGAPISSWATTGDSGLDSGLNYYKGIAESDIPNEEDVYNQTIARFQKEIDAVNNVYSGILNKTRQEGLNRSGSAGARQARGGLLGSERGAAIDTNTTTFNLEQENLIDAERLMKIQEILGEARQGAAKEIADKRAAKEAGYAKYKEYLSLADERKAAKVNELAASLLAQGIDPTKLSSQELNSIIKESGVDKNSLLASYRKAQKEGGFSLSEGEQRYDSAGNLIASGLPKTKATGMSSQETIDTANAVANGVIKITDLAPTQRAAVAAELNRNGMGGVIKQQNLSYANEKAKSLQTFAQQAIEQLNTLGDYNPIISTASRNIPGTQMYELNKLIDTVKANIGFNELQKMRAASPTGGALGQVSERELAYLQSVEGNLDIGRGNKPLVDALTAIINSSKNWQNTVASDSGSSNTDSPNTQSNLSEQDMATVEDMRAQNIPDDVIEQVIGKPISLDNVGGDTNQATVEKLKSAIAMRESSGNSNPYTIRSGKPSIVNGKKDWAYGKYQIMGNNIPSWTKEALGRPMTIEEFRNSPEAQEQVATYKFNQYLSKYGNIEDAASAWFTGGPLAQNKNKRDSFGTLASDYVRDVAKYYNT